MKAYAYVKNNINHFAGLGVDMTADTLITYCKAHVPLGCPFFFLSDEDVAEIGTTPPEAIIFDDTQADGIGEAE